MSQWNYVFRTCSSIARHLQALENFIRSVFIPTLFSRDPPDDTRRDLYALPCRLGGLGIMNPISYCTSQSTASALITSPLVDLIVQQADSLSDSTIRCQLTAKQTTQRLNRHLTSTAYNSIRSKLTSSDLRYIDIASEKGASSWLTVLPIKRHGFNLHKGAFRDGLCLRYGLRPPSLPDSCVCGKQFSIEHSLSCLYGGFPTLRHNDVRDLTAELMKPITQNLTIEPKLQTLTGETFNSRSCCTSDDARPDIKADGLWDNRFQSTYFDICVFNPLSKSYRNKSLSSLYRQQEQEKLRKYEERVTHVEHGSFTPLVFTISEGLSPITTTTFKRIADLLSRKLNDKYHTTISWIRCKLSFALVRSSIRCLRGSRSLKAPQHSPILSPSLDMTEARALY